ncbi:hypothetical protein Hanom_Chr07g00661291 [Helianthus anomalus]
MILHCFGIFHPHVMQAHKLHVATNCGSARRIHIQILQSPAILILASMYPPYSFHANINY